MTANSPKCAVALGRPELAADPRYIKNADRVRNMPDLLALIAEIFAQWKRADLVAALEKAGVPCGPINSIAEVFEIPEQIKHRGMRMELPHPRSGTVPSVANPISLPEHTDPLRSRPADARSATAMKFCVKPA